MALSKAATQHLASICGESNVLTHPDELLVYECDAYPLARQAPLAVVFPTSTEQVSAVLSYCGEQGVPYVSRGAGTSLAGGCLSTADSVCISTARMNRVLEIDAQRRCAAVQAGVVTQEISEAAERWGLCYLPDPSSQTTCTIGGNVANNAGGPHTLKYGVTAQHVLGLTVVLSGGQILRLGGKSDHTHGYDLKSVFVGSEGTLGLICEVLVRLSIPPPAVRTVLAVFDAMRDAGETVARIMADGIMPSALEIMDQYIINLVEDAYGYGFDRDAGAVLIIELDGIEVGLEQQLNCVLDICRSRRVRSLKYASTPQDRQLLWKARKTAFGALGRMTPNCITQDGVVPRSQLPRILEFVQQVARKYDLCIANNFHAGDGNIHPNLLFNLDDQDQVRRVLQASDDILEECIRLGGSITGEHGVGIEKIEMLKRMYAPVDLDAQKKLRDVFDPRHLANPNKVFGADPD